MSTTEARENRWFRENERQLLEQVRREREQRLEAYREETEKEDRERLRQAHWMRCPKCGNEMKVEQLESIEIERCSVCGGMFFEHNELQTLLMRKQESRFKFYRNMFGLD